MAKKSKSLKWLGKAVTEKMLRAQIAGVKETMAACVVDAKQNHTWRNQSGELEGSIDIAVYPRAEMNGVRGTWGARDSNYARIHELGGVIRPKHKKALKFRAEDGSFVTVKKVTIPARPYLRPAADKEYPRLASRIRKAFERASKDG